MSEDHILSKTYALDQALGLPSELWLEVLEAPKAPEDISQAELRSTLSNVSRVCRHLCEIARPILFGDMRFSGILDDNEFSVDRHLGWCAHVRAQEAEPHSLASYVRSYTLSEWSNRQQLLSDQDPSGPSVLREHIQVLPLLSHLQDLRLELVSLQDADIDIVFSLDGLQSLRLIRCKWLQPKRRLEVTSAMPRLKTFEHRQDYSTMGDFFVEYMPKVLEVVVTPALRSWKTDDQALARNFLLSDSLLVDDLQIPVQKDDLPLLSKFLNRMPSIVVFNMVGLGSLSRDEFQEFDLEPTALPNLRSLRCPLGLLPSFLPGRPIRKLHIQDYAPRAVRRTFRHFEVDAPSLVAVKRTTCAIEELTVPMSIYDNVALEDYFPTLKLLRIDDDRGLPLLIKSHNPEVDELQCNCHQDDPDESDRLGSYGLDLRKQRELLLQLQNAFPEVTKVAVTWSSIRWRRSDATSTDWRPFVADRDSLRTRLLMAVKYPELTPLRLVDEDGCIANVFRPDEMTPALHAMFQPAEQSQ